MKTALLRAAFFTPMPTGDWGLPLVLKGPPGTSKTASVREIGAEYQLHVERLSPAERGEGEFGVIPVPSPDMSVLLRPPPEWVAKLRTGKDGEEAGILFFDEIDKAPPALQPVLLGGVQERTIGAKRFGPRVRVLCAMNLSGQGGSWDLNPAVANRLGHITWDAPSAEDWSIWLLSGGQGVEVETKDARAEEKRVMKLWPEAYAKASGLAAGFIKRRPELLHKMPPDGDPAQAGPWPSPRSWEYAARAWASSQIHRLSAIDRDELISAFIGTAAAAEWQTWVTEADLPEPAEILDGKVDYEHDPARLDRTVAILGAMAALVSPPKSEHRVDRATRLWTILSAVAEDAKDLTVPPMRALVLAGLAKLEVARPVLAKLHAVVTAAKLSGGK